MWLDVAAMARACCPFHFLRLNWSELRSFALVGISFARLSIGFNMVLTSHHTSSDSASRPSSSMSAIPIKLDIDRISMSVGLLDLRVFTTLLKLRVRDVGAIPLPDHHTVFAKPVGGFVRTPYAILKKKLCCIALRFAHLVQTSHTDCSHRFPLRDAMCFPAARSESVAAQAIYRSIFHNKLIATSRASSESESNVVAPSESPRLLFD
jgi:hypothetical protein